MNDQNCVNSREILTIRRPIAAIFLTFVLLSTSIFIAFLQAKYPYSISQKQHSISSTSTMVAPRSFILWLHGLGDSGPANEPVKNFFTSPQFRNTKWSFPCAPVSPVTCNHGALMPSWFDVPEIPVTANSPKDESGLLKAVRNVHAIIDKEIAAGTNPENVFVCGFSQGGSLTLASVLLYPKTLGGGAVFSGWIAFNSSLVEQIPPAAKMTPILWLHGIDDRTVLFETGQAGPPLLEKAGISCEFKAYPGLGHSISDKELQYLESWIKSRLSSCS